ncbi:DUF5610 domain-containing protein [Dongshaea marina]|uniref:DUF5610 domain-containing protein n=1 Tax=Dongshaea marina TaxID=2047966 RepID=UPI000D3E69E4|nr:DUF5610 domain-containing protein [Dongshaea marina]
MEIHGLREALLARLQPPGVKAESPGSQQTDDKPSLFDRSSAVQIGFKAVSLSLHMHVRLEGKELPEVKEPAEPPLEFDFEAVARNVMDFVEARVRYAQADGADDEKLRSMMDAARRGIDEGFSQAREELEGLGVMTEKLSEGIDKSYDLIGERMQAFEDELFGVKEQPVLQAVDTRFAAAEQKQTSLEITTNDGDKVTLNIGERSQAQFSHSVSPRAAAAYGLGPNEGHSQASEHRELSSEKMHLHLQESRHFSLSVEGELDDEELAAIGELVSQLDELATTFFAGDLDEAFEMATQVGYDDEELMGFAFNLKHSRAVSVSQTYQQELPQPEVRDSLLPLADYADLLKDFTERAQVTLPEEELPKLTEQVVLMQPNLEEQPKFMETFLESLNEFNKFNERLLKVISDLA